MLMPLLMLIADDMPFPFSLFFISPPSAAAAFSCYHTLYDNMLSLFSLRCFRLLLSLIRFFYYAVLSRLLLPPRCLRAGFYTTFASHVARRFDYFFAILSLLFAVRMLDTTILSLPENMF